jgi:histidinol-phosphate aminotransferase
MQIENQWIDELGVYEPGKPIEEVARELGFDVAGICKLASNENSLGPSPRAIQAIREAAPMAFLYPDGGAYYLRQALSAKLGFAPEMIAVGNGSNELLDMLGRIYLDRGLNVVMADRAFVVYRLVPPAYQAQVKSVPMKDFRHDLEAMLEAIDENTRIVFVANPNNPTGTHLSQGEIDDFMAKVPEHVAVVFDEAYVELMPPEAQVDTLKYVGKRPHVYVMRTFSKAYGLAGLRIGYCVAGVEEIRLVNRVRQPFNTNRIAQVAATAALEDEAHVEATRRMVQEGLAYLEQQCRELDLEFVPSVANFMLIKVGKGREVFVELQKRRVIVRPMDGYQLPEWVRVTVGKPEENRQFTETLKQLIEEGIITL